MPNAIDLIAGMVMGIVGCFVVGYGLFLASKPLASPRTNAMVFRAAAIITIGLFMVSFTVFAVLQAFN
jgi:uncharacterized membrane protein